MTSTTIVLVLGFQAAQDPVDPEKLFAELRETVAVHTSISAKLTFESVDAKGVRTDRYNATLYFQPAEGWLHFTLAEAGKEKVNHTILDRDRSVLGWEQGDKGRRMDVRPLFQALLAQQFEFGRSRRKLLGEPEYYKDLGEFAASRKPQLFLQVEPDRTEGAAVRLALLMTEKGGFSWLRSPPRAGKVEATADEVTIAEHDPARTTVIDRRTGFLRSIRTEIAGPASRVMTVTEFKPGALKPEVRLPEKVTDRSARIADAHALLVPDLTYQATSGIQDCLEGWATAGREDRAKDLRDYISRIAAEYAALELERSHVFWASAFVKNAVDGGSSLEDLTEEIDEQADELKAYLESGEKAYADRFADSLARFRTQLEKEVRTGPGPEEAKQALIKSLTEGFEPERIRAVHTIRTRPDPSRLLREAIEAARDHEKK